MGSSFRIAITISKRGHGRVHVGDGRRFGTSATQRRASAATTIDME